MKAKARKKLRVKRARETRPREDSARKLASRVLRLEDEVAILTSRVDALAPPVPEPAG